MMNIKEYYMNKYPQDELGVELNENATFVGLLNCLYEGNDVYEYIGEGDSIIRERLFENLALLTNKEYSYIYDLWLS
jgi:hypothetical protein